MHTMHLLPGVAIQPNLELKTRPKQLLGSLLLVIALPDFTLDLGKELNLRGHLVCCKMVYFCVWKETTFVRIFLNV
jgi:hypothetical protein